MHNLRHAPIDPANPTYRDALQHAVGLIQRRQLALFAGAGVSRPSGLPTSPTLKTGLIDVMGQAIRSVDVGAAADWPEIKATLWVHPLERLLDGLVESLGDEAMGYLDVLKGHGVNFNHEAVATLGARGFIDSVVTLNFDTLYEEAILNKGVGLRLVLPLAAYDQRVDGTGGCVSVVKPHGTLMHPRMARYERHFLAATLRYAGDRPQRENHRALAEVARRNEGLLVSGYRNEDWDITPILSSFDWSFVLWIHHSRAPAESAREGAGPSGAALDWLQSGRPEAAFILHGDPRDLLRDLLNALGLSHEKPLSQVGRGAWLDEPEIEPDPSVFSRSLPKTAFATIRLMDGVKNQLFRKYVSRFSTVSPYRPGDPEHATWLLVQAWYLQAHRRDIRSAIRLRQEVDRLQQSSDSSPTLDELGRILSAYYGRVSAAKQPNPRWPFDLIVAARLRKVLSTRAAQLRASSGDPWTAKEIDRRLGMAEYYLVDLVHNWAYPLLLFNNRAMRWLTRVVFKHVALRYSCLAHRFPVLDWEYHYVRRVEARLLAGGLIPGPRTERRLGEVAAMFHQTGGGGHEDNAMAVRSILRHYRGVSSAYDDFCSAKGAMLGADRVTPTGRVRMVLFERHFWPAQRSFLSALVQLIRYALPQHRRDN